PTAHATTVTWVVNLGVAQAQRTDTASNLRPQHKEVVEQWLKSSARLGTLRVATVVDCLNKSGLAATRKEQGRNYQPYYAVGDFNRDGREDFAVAFVNDRKRQRKFSFAIFNGPFGKGSVPAYIDEAVDISQMGFVYGGKGSDLLLGEFESDYCVIFKPRGKSYRGKPCLED
ncbi:MAG: hypothetical protein ACRD2L_01565, partial [Terriglobia bacterium]